MGSLDKKLRKVAMFSNFEHVLNSIIKDNQKEIIALNRDQMWEEGIVDVKRNLQWDYQPSTIRQKKRKAKFKKTSFITLRWEGDFYDKMKLVIKPKSFIITSTDEKWDFFKSGKWGEGRFKDALGLTKESLSELRELVKSDLIIGFKHAIQSS